MRQHSLNWTFQWTGRQPVRLKKARRDLLAKTQLDNQASSGVLHSLQR